MTKPTTHPKPVEKPEVAVIIVCWNNQDLLDECFQSIYDQTYKNYRIITIDNGSQDESVNVINKHHPEVELILPGKNLGFAIANNIGIKKAFENPRCKYVLLLNTDARIKSDWMEKIVAFAEKHPDGAAFQSLTVDYYNHDIIDSCGILIDRSGLATQKGYRLKHVKLETQKVFGVNAAAALYSRSFLENQPFGDDYFDSDLFMYLEDVDIAARSIMLGWNNYFVNETTAYHMGSASSGKNPGFSLYMTHRNNGPMLIKNLPGQTLKKILPGLIRTEFARIRGLSRERQYKLAWQVIKGRLISFRMLTLFYKKRMLLKRYWKVKEKNLWDLMANPRPKRLTPNNLGLDNQNVVIVVLCKNNINTLQSSLDSLVNQSYGNAEIVVVDNGSNDGSVEYVSSKFPTVHMIKNNKDFGTAGGFNEGIVYAQKQLPDYIALARADVVYDKDWLRKLIEPFGDKLDLFAVSSAIKIGKEVIVGYDYSPGLIPKYKTLLAGNTKKTAVFAPHGYGTLYQAELLQKTGIFDGIFYNYLEEVDLAFKARNMGFNILFEPAAKGMKEGGESDSLTQMLYHQYKNSYYVFIKNTPLKIILAALPEATLEALKMLLKLAINKNAITASKIIVKCLLKTPHLLSTRSTNQKLRTQNASSVRKSFSDLV